MVGIHMIPTRAGVLSGDQHEVGREGYGVFCPSYCYKPIFKWLTKRFKT